MLETPKGSGVLCKKGNSRPPPQKDTITGSDSMHDKDIVRLQKRRKVNIFGIYRRSLGGARERLPKSRPM